MEYLITKNNLANFMSYYQTVAVAILEVKQRVKKTLRKSMLYKFRKEIELSSEL